MKLFFKSNYEFSVRLIINEYTALKAALKLRVKIIQDIFNDNNIDEKSPLPVVIVTDSEKCDSKKVLK